MVLFRISTHYQLLSAFIIKTQVLTEIEADLHLCNLTTFSEEQVQGIRDTGLFRKVLLVNIRNWTNEWIDGKWKSPAKFISNLQDNIIPDVEYDTLYFGHDMIPNKLYYYFLLSVQDKAPDIYLLEDGVSSYSHCVLTHARMDKISHDIYKEDSFLKKIKGRYLYNPEVSFLSNEYPILAMPEVSDIDRIRSIMFRTYGKNEGIPDYPFILFTSCFYEDKFTANELDVVKKFASIVGKSNLIIKEHPRAVYNIYRDNGFNVIKKSRIPWEFYLLSSKIQSKIFVSICSNSMFSLYNIFRIKTGIISLHNFYTGNFDMLDQPSYKMYLERIKKTFNSEEPQCFYPQNESQLHEVIKYVKGKWLHV